jgi:tetratricopeptide (TPR) repeat protein
MDYDRLRELQQKYDENPRRYFAPLANEYRKGGQLKRAIEICRAQLAEMPGHMSGQIVFGQALYESGEFEEARQVFERAIALDPENLIALRSLGDMSLQAGETREARTWYTRLLDADPKDTAVIALVTEIDAASDGAPVPMSEEIPGVDSDAGDQEIPALEPEVAQPPVAEQQAAPAAPDSHETESTGATAVSPASHDLPPMNSEVAAAESASAPEGLERHYPTEEAGAQHENVELPPPALTREELGVPIGNSAAEGLKSMKEDVNAFSWSPPPEPPPVEPPLVSRRPPPPPRDARPAPAQPAPREVRPAPMEPVAPPEAAAPEPVVAPELAAAAEAVTNAFAEPAQSEPVEKSVAEPPASIAEKQTTAATSGEKTFTGASGEPFVNETMAQLYLQQGYKQLALRIYRQLAESRPHDASLQSRIAEIEAEDAAAHPDEIAARKEALARKEASSEKPADRPFPRSPAIESPPPPAYPASPETPGFGEAPIESPPTREPSRQRESVERPVREESRAEPEGMSARQPSIREFFATLGKRKPPRAAASAGPSHGGGNNQPAESQTPLGAAPASATLDTVFAGATVSPSDARAASRLAGAFSGASGASRTPPTPPMPTPRVNARVPQAQESEEDVAKFRAWLDGLTGE